MLTFASNVEMDKNRASKLKKEEEDHKNRSLNSPSNSKKRPRNSIDSNISLNSAKSNKTNSPDDSIALRKRRKLEEEILKREEEKKIKNSEIHTLSKLCPIAENLKKAASSSLAVLLKNQPEPDKDVDKSSNSYLSLSEKILAGDFVEYYGQSEDSSIKFCEVICVQESKEITNPLKLYHLRTKPLFPFEPRNFDVSIIAIREQIRPAKVFLRGFWARVRPKILISAARKVNFRPDMLELWGDGSFFVSDNKNVKNKSNYADELRIRDRESFKQTRTLSMPVPKSENFERVSQATEILNGLMGTTQAGGSKSSSAGGRNSKRNSGSPTTSRRVEDFTSLGVDDAFEAAEKNTGFEELEVSFLLKKEDGLDSKKNEEKNDSPMNTSRKNRKKSNIPNRMTRKKHVAINCALPKALVDVLTTYRKVRFENGEEDALKESEVGTGEDLLFDSSGHDHFTDSSNFNNLSSHSPDQSRNMRDLRKRRSGNQLNTPEKSSNFANVSRIHYRIFLDVDGVLNTWDFTPNDRNYKQHLHADKVRMLGQLYKEFQNKHNGDLKFVLSSAWRLSPSRKNALREFWTEINGGKFPWDGDTHRLVGNDGLEKEEDFVSVRAREIQVYVWERFVDTDVRWVALDDLPLDQIWEVAS